MEQSVQLAATVRATQVINSKRNLEISHSKKTLASYDQKYVVVFTSSSQYSCPILMNLKFFQQGFSKNT